MDHSDEIGEILLGAPKIGQTGDAQKDDRRD
jgi:hypothetical protein